MNIEKSIQNKIEERKNNIMKGIVEYGSNISPRQAISMDEIEKARNVGETKVGKDGITRVWTQLPNGKFDWRRQSGKPSETKTDSNVDSDKESLDDLKKQYKKLTSVPLLRQDKDKVKELKNKIESFGQLQDSAKNKAEPMKFSKPTKDHLNREVTEVKMGDSVLLKITKTLKNTSTQGKNYSNSKKVVFNVEFDRDSIDNKFGKLSKYNSIELDKKPTLELLSKIMSERKKI